MADTGEDDPEGNDESFFADLPIIDDVAEANSPRSSESPRSTAGEAGASAAHDVTDAAAAAASRPSVELVPYGVDQLSAPPGTQLFVDVRAFAHQLRGPEQPPIIANSKEFRLQLELVAAAAPAAGSSSSAPPPPQPLLVPLPTSVSFRVSVVLAPGAMDAPGARTQQYTPLETLRVESSHPPLLLLRGETEVDVAVNGQSDCVLQIGHGVLSQNYLMQRNTGAHVWTSMAAGSRSSPSDGGPSRQSKTALFCLRVEPTDPALAAAHPGLIQYTQPAFQVNSRVRAPAGGARSPRDAGEEAPAATRFRSLSISSAKPKPPAFRVLTGLTPSTAGPPKPARPPLPLTAAKARPPRSAPASAAAAAAAAAAPDPLAEAKAKAFEAAKAKAAAAVVEKAKEAAAAKAQAAARAQAAAAAKAQAAAAAKAQAAARAQAAAAAKAQAGAARAQAAAAAQARAAAPRVAPGLHLFMSNATADSINTSDPLGSSSQRRSMLHFTSTEASAPRPPPAAQMQAATQVQSAKQKGSPTNRREPDVDPMALLAATASLVASKEQAVVAAQGEDPDTWAKRARLSLA